MQFEVRGPAGGGHLLSISRHFDPPALLRRNSGSPERNRTSAIRGSGELRRWSQTGKCDGAAAALIPFRQARDEDFEVGRVSYVLSFKSWEGRPCWRLEVCSFTPARNFGFLQCKTSPLAGKSPQIAEIGESNCDWGSHTARASETACPETSHGVRDLWGTYNHSRMIGGDRETTRSAE